MFKMSGVTFLMLGWWVIPICIPFIRLGQGGGWGEYAGEFWQAGGSYKFQMTFLQFAPHPSPDPIKR